MKIVDLRSDTVTKPSHEMWDFVKSMDNSRLGDDVMGEDPSVNELEENAAKLIGKQIRRCLVCQKTWISIK